MRQSAEDGRRRRWEREVSAPLRYPGHVPRASRPPVTAAGDVPDGSGSSSRPARSDDDPQLETDTVTGGGPVSTGH